MNPAEPIAIIGMAGRFPGAPDVEKFWQNLRDGVEAVSTFSRDELLRAGIDPDIVRNPQYVPARGVIDDTSLFDAAFFGINPREAEVIDPQHRVFLESAWEALENAGYEPRTYAGSIGVYAGVGLNMYLLGNLLSNPEIIQTVGAYQTMLASDKDFLTTRVSYKLNLRGPSVDLQTACSTSLVAVQFACQGLLNRQCDIALAGGVSLMIPQRAGYLYQPGMILSPDGHCRAFDAEARGTVPGEGAGIVVLKRLADALADGDCIRAVIRGAAVNNDGSMKVGYTAPSVDGQAEVIVRAQTMAGVEPDSVSYVEAHGTATELGDPIEIAALTRAFRSRTSARGFCAIGSVKSNIGHLDTAAGVAGLIKTVLALEHGFVPPSLHFSHPNRRIDFANSPFFVNAGLRPWPRGASPRRAGVSSFGIGGTNAHVVLEEAPLPAPHASMPTVQLLTLSARTPVALDMARKRLAAHLQSHPSLDLADVAFTLQRGRRSFAHRAALVCRSVDEAAAALADGADSRRLLLSDRPAADRPLAFLFPGQGSQYVNMARGLYEQDPAFRADVDACAETITSALGVDLRTVLYPPAERVEGAEATLRQTSFAQPALFIIEYALAALWMRRGLVPAAMIGHSIGEYVAACLAGVLSLDDALTLVVERGRLMQIPGGAMMAVPLAEAQVAAALSPDLSIAASNAPSLCVVSGPEASLAALERKLKGDGVQYQRLHTAHAFHSEMMTPALAPFRERVARVRLRVPTIPYLSNVTGTWITEQEATDPEYYVRHLRGTVRFSPGLVRLLEDPDRILLEVGPGHTLASLARQHQASGRTIVSSLRHPHDQQPDVDVLTTALGRLWVAGAPVDWAALHAGGGRRRVPLPSYPFERQRYWVSPKPVETDAIRRKATRKRADLSTWFYAPSWRRVPLTTGDEPAAANQAPWLVFAVDGGLGDRLAATLTKRGTSVIVVTPGDRFEQHSERRYRIAPGSAADHAELVRALHTRKLAPERVVHCWSMLSDGRALPLDAAGRRAAHERGFLSLMALMQKLGELKGSAPLRVAVVTDRLQEVAGEPVVAPERAAVFGLATVIPQEYPGVVCRAIDVSPVEPGSAEDVALLDDLASELADRAAASGFVAYRGGRRWLRTFEPCRLEASEQIPALLRRGGTFLITGGLGGIGLVLAEYLARTVAPKLVLTGRSGLPRREDWDTWLAAHDAGDETSRRIRKVEALEALGAEVLVVAADVSDREQMERCLATARTRFGTIDGVIHSAGLPGGGIIQLRTPEASAEVQASKVDGTALLMSLLTDTPPDFVLLCSSITAILGGPGQADYCGANACLDAFARTRPAGRRAPRVISVNWDAWQEVGMAVNTPVPRAARAEREEYIRNSILPAEGAEAFARILTSTLSEVVVSTRDFVLIEALSQPQSDGGAEPAVEPTSTEQRPAADGEGHARSNVSTAFAAPRTQLEQAIARMWERLLAIEQVGIHDDFFELGGHSLLATQLISRLREGVGVEFPLREVFEARTVAAMAERITIIQTGARLAPNGDSSLDREEIEL